jgi:hypothetical protein
MMHDDKHLQNLFMVSVGSELRYHMYISLVLLTGLAIYDIRGD